MSAEIIVAIIGAVAPTLAVIITWKQQKNKIIEVHTLVNSRLDAALREISLLRGENPMLRKTDPHLESKPNETPVP